MANDTPKTYLNDHLANSVLVLDLLDRLVEEVDEEPAAELRAVRMGIATNSNR